MLSADTYNLWFAPLRACSQEDNHLTLEVANDFCEVWLKDNYMDLLKDVVALASGRQLEIRFKVVSGSTPAVPVPQPPAVKKKTVELSPERSAGNQEPSFNPKNTFDTFVVGNNNNFAYAAALAVAQAPGKSYNPLFLYGGVGLGKTHLLHAIGHYVVTHKKGARVAYLSSERFTNEYIDGIQNNQIARFRKKYRLTDVLLIDDIQFLAGKERIQEEFFHTFNALHEGHKQIVLTCDRPASEIQNLEHRLVSRFEWGLVTDIQPPDFETRMAILRKKSEKETIALPDDVYYFLAEKIKSNIRELEGALIRVVAYAKLIGREISVDMVKEVLKDMIREGEKKITIDMIQKKVCEYFDIKLSDMKIKKRSRAIAYPRQIAMYLARQLTDYSLPEIGEYFGGRDHTTVMHAYEKIKTDLKEKKGLSDLIGRVTDNIGGP